MITLTILSYFWALFGPIMAMIKEWPVKAKYLVLFYGPFLACVVWWSLLA